ncbi:Sof1-like protein [Trinorchestia longiramus]|nr:Sof1-like protein [Trinorchestia longiramus]
MATIKKLHVLSRNPDNYMQETRSDIPKFLRNYDPDLHPFRDARNYKLALNATKLERVFAKPFIASLVHGESISSMARHPEKLNFIFSGTYEGQLTLWDTSLRQQMWKVQAHNSHIWSITADCQGETFFTVGHDKAIKRWSCSSIAQASDRLDIFKGAGSANYLSEPIDTWLCDHCCAAGGSQEQLGEERGGAASCDHDNSLILYDIRAKDVKKLKMKLRLNDICWNPTESFVLSAASDDYNSYTFDVRMMDSERRILTIHQGHTSAVTCLDYSPTGRELVSGSFDRSIRIFRVDEGRSRDVYHGKRMHKVTSVMFSADDKFIYSGSADHNIRIWKSRASEKMGLMNARETSAINLSTQLRETFKDMPEIRRIARHRHVPKSIKAAAKEHHLIRTSRARKEANVRLHSAKGVVVGETSLQKPVFGLQDEQDPDPHTEGKELQKLLKFGAGAKKRIKKRKEVDAAAKAHKEKETEKKKLKRLQAAQVAASSELKNKSKKPTKKRKSGRKES